MMESSVSTDHRRMRLRPVLLTLLAAVALVAAGCGGAAAPERTLMSLSSSAEKTRAAETYRMDLRLAMTMPGIEKPLEISATGAVDAAARRQSMTMDMSSILGALGPAAGANAPSADALQVDVVMDGLTMYMRMPLLAAQLPAGKTWVSVDAGKAAASSGADLSSLLERSYADPSQYLEYLRTAGALEELGSEEVRGVPTRHVRTTVDLKAYLATLEPELRKSLAPSVEKFEEMAGSAKPVMDAWVDDEGLVRRVGLDMRFGVPGASGGDATMSMTVDLYDFGADVVVEVPPAAQVADGAALGLGG